MGVGFGILRTSGSGGGGGGTTINTVANYSALPPASSATGQFYWCEASQGTKWLPFSVGGTYYPLGMYYSNGTTWEYSETPYQATLSEVNTGTNTDKFVSPYTFTNADKWSNYTLKTTTISTTSPLQGGGDLSTNRTFSITQANATTDGYLSSADWNTFSGKQNTITLTTTGSSGASTFISNTLNVPTYTLSGLGGVPTSRQLTINGTAFDLSADRSWTVGTVTSVGLTMPTAFMVTNSPIISNGSISVTGAGTTAQYIRGDGTLANFPNSTGGGSSVNYYLNGSVSQGTFGGDTYYQMSKTPILGAGTNFTRTNGAGNGYIASFITDAGDPSFLNIPAGNWNLEFYFQSSASGGSPQFYGEIYKVSATNVFTLVASGSVNPEGITNGTTIDQYFTSIPLPQTSLLITDRLAIRIYVITGGRTITLHTENGNLCEVLTTFTTGLTALNGLTDQVQFFQVGTSGTDFNISSVTDTHTFNLPTASATNRGALSSSDWSTFSGKQNALTIGNITDVGTDGITITGGTNAIIGSGVSISQQVANATQNGYLSSTDWVTFNTANFIPKLGATETYRGININNNSTTVVTEGGVTMSSSASTTAQSVASTNFSTKQIRLRYSATVVSGGRYTGTRGSALLWFLHGGFRFICDFNISDTAYSAGCQQFYGLAGQTTDLAYGGVSGTLVSTLTNIIGIGSENGDANLSVFHNDATGTATKVDLGVGFPSNRTVGAISTTVYSIQLYNEPMSTDVKYEVKNNETGSIASGTISTNLPLTSQGLNFFASRCMSTTSVTSTGQFDLSKLGVYSQL